MATSDCFASFVQGTSELGQAAGTAVAAPVAAAVGGLFKGLFNPGAGQQGCDPTAFWCNYGSAVLIGGGLLALILIMGGGRR